MNYIDFINRCHVDFELTPEDEKEIRRKGRYLGKKGLDDLIAAIKSNYHAKAPPPPNLEEPTFTEKNDSVTFTVGSKSVTVPMKTGPVQFDVETEPSLPIKLYIEDNKPYVDAELFVGTGRPSVTLRHNQLANLPPMWDRNSSKVALEIVNENQNPVFQLYYKNPTHVVVNGIFALPPGPSLVTESGVAIITEDGLTLTSESLNTIKPIFRYPSWMYPGQYADERPTSIPNPNSITQTMTNSPGGIQAGGNVTINQAPEARHLTMEQHARLLEKLNQSPKGNVLIKFALSNGEAEDFARELGAVLDEAGWNVLGYIPTSLNVDGVTPKGLLVYLPTEDANAKALFQALSQTIPVAPLPTSGSDIGVVLYVGR